MKKNILLAAILFIIQMMAAQNWSPQGLAVDLENEYNIYSIDALNPNWLVATGEQARVFITEGGGHFDSWFDLGPVIPTIKWTAIYFGSNNIGWAVGNDAEERQYAAITNDGGLTWETRIITTSINNFLSDQINKVHLVSPTEIYFINSFGQIYYSSNGSNWTDMTDLGNVDEFLDIAFDPLNERGWVAGKNGKIWYKDANTSNWIQVHIQSGKIFRSIDPINSNTVWAVGDNKLAKKSINGGATWQDAVIDPTLGNTADFFDVYFINEQEGWIASSGGLYHTQSGGNFWDKIYEGEVLQAEFRSTDEGLILMDNGQLIYTNTGFSETTVSNYNHQHFFWKNNKEVVTTENDYLLASYSNNLNLSHEEYDILFGYSDALAVTFKASGNIEPWVVGLTNAGGYDPNGSDGFIAKNSSLQWGTEAWEIKLRTTSENVRDIHFINPSTAYAATIGTGTFFVIDPGMIYRTIDGGETWSNFFSSNQYAFYAIQSFNEETLIAIAKAEGFQTDYSLWVHTLQNGWEMSYSQPDEAYRTMSCKDDFCYVLVFDYDTDEYALLFSNTNGATWSKTWLQDIPFPIQNIAFIDEDRGWLIGDGGKVRYTSDGGNTWQTQYSGTGRNLNDIVALDENHAWIVGDDTRFLFSSEPIASANDAVEVLDWSIHPNPASGEVVLQWELEHPAPVEFDLLDINGRLISNLLFDVPANGAQQIQLPHLSTGVYLVRLSQKGNATLRKLVVL